MNAVTRLKNDVARLNRAERELKNDQRDLKKDRKELAKDRKELERDRSEFKKDAKALAQAKEVRARHVDARDAALKPLEAQQAKISEQLASDTFDYDANQPGVQQNPELLAELATVKAQRDAVGARYSPLLAADQAAIDKAAAERKQDLFEIKKDKKEIAHDKKVIEHDRKELAHDRKAIKHHRKVALKHLRPAEYKLGLKATNRFRKELGLKPVDHVIRPMNLNTVKGCAQFLLESNNVSFWTGLSTGSDRKNLERLANGGKAYVAATGGWVTPKLSMMKALVEMAKRGPIMINALTGGIHSTGSNHYRGTAVDLEVTVGNTREIESIARKYGGLRNWERDHIHIDF